MCQQRAGVYDGYLDLISSTAAVMRVCRSSRYEHCSGTSHFAFAKSALRVRLDMLLIEH